MVDKGNAQALETSLSGRRPRLLGALPGLNIIRHCIVHNCYNNMGLGENSIALRGRRNDEHHLDLDPGP